MGRVIIVTGGSTGIGKAAVTELVNEGHSVVFGSRRAEVGKKLENELSTEKAAFCQIDVTKDQDWVKLIDFTITKYGKVDGLVNSAGIFGPSVQDPANFSSDDFLNALDVNVVSVQRGIRHVFPHLQDGGFIVNVSSGASAVTTANAGLMTCYAASKSALNALTRGTANSYSSKNIFTAAICPWVFETEMIGDVLKMPVMQSIGITSCDAYSMAFNPLPGASKQPSQIGKVFSSIFSGSWKYANGMAVGVCPDNKNGCFTFDMSPFFTVMQNPTQWYNDALLLESTTLCDFSGQPLPNEEAKSLRAEIQQKREQLHPSK